MLPHLASPICLRGSTDAFSQAMMVKHAIDVKIFHTESSELIEDLSTVLMGKVVTSPFRSFMHPRHHPAMSAPFFRAFRQFGMLALHLGQSFLLTAEEARISNFLSGGQGGKGLESNIKTYWRWFLMLPIFERQTRSSWVMLNPL
jgi:hypothetical protein